MWGSDYDICIIEDDGSQRSMLAAQLRRCGYRVHEAATGAEGLRAVYYHRPKVLICDIVLPDIDGIEICRQVRADPTLDGTYVILITAYDGNGRKHTALNAGADDYLSKPWDPEELKARLRNGLRFVRLQERLEQAAQTDSLTGLWNHSHFRTLLKHEFMRTRRYGGHVALLMLDLDHFKAVNDTYGHETGNKVLQKTSQYLKRVVRGTDTVARYGGEEFAVICPETPFDEAANLAERIRAGFPDAVRLSAYRQLRPTVSIGVSSVEDPRVTSVTELIDLADKALYHSKHIGRDRVSRCDRLEEVEPDAGVLTDEVDRLRKELVTLNLQAKELCLQSVWSLIQALDARDPYSVMHSRNVTLYTEWLAEAANWSAPLRRIVTNAAMLHDLGKIGVPDRLLLKRDQLDESEAELMRQVPAITARILDPLRVFEPEIQVIRHLRERYDGRGYPDGLAGEQIPLGSRLIAIAETVDAITCARAHRPARSLDVALMTIAENAKKQFDPELTRLLIAHVEQHRKRWQTQILRARTTVREQCEVALAGSVAPSFPFN